MDKIRVRMAPSPTGYLHIGTARTALFNYLFARCLGGTFIMRIEDTDVERSSREFEKDIIDGLHWLGMTWDEGPDVGGEYGPYRQSERLEHYSLALRKLYDTGVVYKCFCTEEELTKEREEQMWNKLPPLYGGRCRDLAPEAAAEKEVAGVRSTLRFRVPAEQLTVHDLIKGDITFDTSLIGDFVIAKDFDTALYNFAVVVDDYEMKISHVIRGEDHISNIPKQVLLGRALGYPTPQFAHIPLILNSDRSKLSKRKNKVSLLDYRAEGYLPEGLVNFMALLGWNPGGERELFTLAELTEIFEIDRVNKSGAIFDLVKLDWFNAHYIKEAPLDELLTLVMPHLVDGGFLQWPEGDIMTTESFATPQGEKIVRKYLIDIIALERVHAKRIPEIVERIGYFFAEPAYDPAILAWKGMEVTAVKASLELARATLSALSEDQFTQGNLETTLKTAITAAGKSNGEILWPLRVALTGLEKSPSPFEVAAIIGKDATLRRITVALEQLA